ncbi:MAG: hypothetical protein AAGG72_05880 [Pseudomonadota bacterium]
MSEAIVGSRILRCLGLAALMYSLAGPLAAHADGGTIRIEPRPFSGAVVTIEQGVRVFRPLPPTNQVIINPHGETPLQVGIRTGGSRAAGSVRVRQGVRVIGGSLRPRARCIPAVGSSC